MSQHRHHNWVKPCFNFRKWINISITVCFKLRISRKCISFRITPQCSNSESARKCISFRITVCFLNPQSWASESESVSESQSVSNSESASESASALESVCFKLRISPWKCISFRITGLFQNSESASESASVSESQSVSNSESASVSASLQLVSQHHWVNLEAQVVSFGFESTIKYIALWVLLYLKVSLKPSVLQFLHLFQLAESISNPLQASFQQVNRFPTSVSASLSESVSLSTSTCGLNQYLILKVHL